MKKLHLGCGDRHIPGWLNVDIQPGPNVNVVRDVRTLPWVEDASVSVIYACTILEHFSRAELPDILQEWKRVLISGGILRVAVPDFAVLAHLYLEGLPPHFGALEIEPLLGILIGGQKDEYDFHKNLFDETRLRTRLEQSGFVDVQRYDWWETEHADVDDYSQAYLPHMDKEKGVLTSLNMEGRKP